MGVKGCAGRLHYSAVIPYLVILTAPFSAAVFHLSHSQHFFSLTIKFSNLGAVGRLELTQMQAD